MAAPTGQPNLIINLSEVYLESDHSEPEQSAIYKNIFFSSDKQKLYGICITPQCEMGKKRSLFHTFCQLIPFDLFLEFQLMDQGLSTEQLQCVNEPNSKQLRGWKKVMDQFRKQFVMNRVYRYHFLPGYNDIPCSFIDFQMIECINHTDICADDKIAVLASPWREQVPTRYSQYQGRIGSAPLSEAIIKDAFTSTNIPLVLKILSG